MLFLSITLLSVNICRTKWICLRVRKGACRALFYLSLFTLANIEIVHAEVVTNLDDSAPRLDVKYLHVSSRGDIEVDGRFLKKLSALATKERANFPEEISIDELHQIADLLTVVVRKKGFKFHSVYLPPQKIKNQSVKLIYQTAVLKKVNVINESSFSDKVLKAPFKRFLEKDLYAKDIENMVLALQRQYDVNVFAFYSRGNHSGEVVLNLKAKDKETHHLAMRIENYGGESTGENRLLAEIKGHSLLKSFDQMSLALLATEGEGNSTYGYFSYQIPTPNLRNTFSIGFGDSSYEIGEAFNALEIDGTSRVARIGYTRNTNFLPHVTGSWSLAYYQRESELNSAFGSALLRQEESQAGGLSFNKAFGQRKGSWRLENYAAVYYGTFTSSDIENEKEQRLKKINYSFKISDRWGKSSAFSTQVSLNVRGQYTDNERMPGVEASALSGAYAVRAIPAGTFSSDAAQFTTLELHWPRLFTRGLSWHLHPYVFADAATGESYTAGAEVSAEVELAGYGIGLEFQWRSLACSLSYAEPTTIKVNDLDVLEDERDAQVLFQLRWR